MALPKLAFFIVLCLIISGVEAHKVSSYGIETVDNVCAGVGDLDQLADITTQLMLKRFPEMGSIRVSCTINNKWNVSMLICKIGKMIANYFAAYICSKILESLQTLDSSLNYIYQAQIWYQDHLGFPITARPYGSFGLERMEIAEVLTQMIKRACLYNMPTTATTTATTVTTATTAFRSKMTSASKKIVEDEIIADSLDEVVMEPVVSSVASYPNLVSTYLLRLN